MTYRNVLQQRAKKNNQAKALRRFSYFDIIRKPLVMTEKAQKDIEEGRYSFIVHSDANKNDVKVAMEKLYNLTPKSVHIMTYKPKFRFNRKVRQGFKKAIVTLKKGDTIELL